MPGQLHDEKDDTVAFEHLQKFYDVRMAHVSDNLELSRKELLLEAGVEARTRHNLNGDPAFFAVAVSSSHFGVGTFSKFTFEHIKDTIGNSLKKPTVNFNIVSYCFKKSCLIRL